MAPTACRRTVSGPVSLRCPRCFSPFPHGTCPLSVSRECLALADGAASFGQGSSGPALLRYRLGLERVPRTGLSPAPARLSRRLPLRALLPLHAGPTTPRAPRRPRFGLVPFRSPLLGESLFVFLSSDYLDVSVRRVGHLYRLAILAIAGLPHSGIRGSKAVRASPRLFAACRALLRLREPRHPPCALRYLSRTAPVPSPLADGGTLSILALVLFLHVNCLFSYGPVSRTRRY